MRTVLLSCCALAGCVSDVAMSGLVQASPQDVRAQPDAVVSVRDLDFEEIARTRTAGDGRFALDVPRGAAIHVVVDDGVRPVAFRGETGIQDTFPVPDGTFFALPDAWFAPWRDAFDGCPDAGSGDGMVLGIASLDFGPGGTSGPPEPCSFAFVEAGDGTRVDACYLDADGLYDPSARITGPTGRFLIPGVGEGPWRFVVGRLVGCDPEAAESSRIGESEVFIPQGGAAARFPALVPL